MAKIPVLSRARWRLPLQGCIMFLCLSCAVTGGIREGATRLVRHVGDDQLRSKAGKGLFVGVSHACADEAEARQDAELHARQSIILSLQSQVESDLVQRLLHQGSPGQIISPDVELDARVRVLSRNLVRVQAESWYIEHRERFDRGRWHPEVQAWCLMRYTRQEHQAMLDELQRELCPGIEQSLGKARNALQSGRGGEGLRLAMQARRQVDFLDRWEGWSATQSGRLNSLKGQLEDVLAEWPIQVLVDAKLDGRDVECGLGPLVARRLRDDTGLEILEGSKNLGRRGACLRVDLRFTSRSVTAGLLTIQGQVEAELESLGDGQVLWRLVEPGHSVKELKESGGKLDFVMHGLLESKAMSDEIPSALVQGVRHRLLDTP